MWLTYCAFSSCSHSLRSCCCWRKPAPRSPSRLAIWFVPLYTDLREAPVNESHPNEAPVPVPPTLVPPPVGPPAAAPPSDPIILVPSITPSVIEAPNSKWITHLSSLIVVSISAAYLIGFVVVNTSLFDYGMVPYDFLQARYVSAGLLYLASTVGLTGIVFLMGCCRFGGHQPTLIPPAFRTPSD